MFRVLKILEKSHGTLGETANPFIVVGGFKNFCVHVFKDIAIGKMFTEKEETDLPSISSFPKKL